MDETSPDRADFSLYDRLQDRFGSALAVTHLNRAALIGMTRSLERTIVTNRLDVNCFINYQHETAWRHEAQRYRRMGELLHSITVFANFPLNQPDDEVAGSLDPSKEVLITLPSDNALLKDWFGITLTPEFSILVCSKGADFGPRRHISQVFDTILSFEPEVIEFALDSLEETIGARQPDALEQVQAARREFAPVGPGPRYVSLLAADFVEQTNYYREMARQLDQEQTKRTAFSHLLHDASQPVTTLVSLLDFASRLKQVLPEEIDLLLGAANQLKQILDQLREANRSRSR